MAEVCKPQSEPVHGHFRNTMPSSLRPRDLALALLVIIVWGLNFAVIKVGVAGVPPLLLGALRYLLAVSYTHLTLPTKRIV